MHRSLLLSLFAVLLFMTPPMACTNFQLGQATARFYDNMNGGLHSFGNFSPSNPSSFSFSAIGDIHTGSPGGDLYVRALQASVADGDAFGLALGDNSTGGTESELLTFNNQGAAQGMTIYPAIGNHDIFFGGWYQYKSIVGRSIYSFDAGVVHFIALDNANGTYGEEQLNWLRADLAATAKPVKIVFQHFPIYMGQYSSLYRVSSDEEISIFKELMEKFGVQMVLSGHYHGFEDHTVGNTRYVVSGNCNHILDIGNNPGYLKVIVNGTTLDIVEKSLP